MFAFFSWIADLLTTLAHFVINLLESLIYFITSIPRFLTYAFAAFGYFPPFLATFLYLIIALAVIFLIINRKGS